MDLMIALLPIVFMLHDFEELIMMKPWLEENEPKLIARFPKVAMKIVSHYKALGESAFTLIVAEEFLVISIITGMTITHQTYWLWFAALMGFALHLVIHVGQWLAYRRYIPAIVTSFIALPYTFYAFGLLRSLGYLTGAAMVYLSIIGLVLVVLNYLLATWIAHRFNAWLLKRY